MSVASGWVSAEFLRALALSLLHFLWQGAAIAALAAFAMGPAKRASMSSPARVKISTALDSLPASASGRRGANTSLLKNLLTASDCAAAVRALS